MNDRSSMARNHHHQLQEDEDDYIDMDISSMASIPNSRDFEFHLSSIASEKEPITSPADELFYRGNLLPLQLPPRMEMVENLLGNRGGHRRDHSGEERREVSEEIRIPPTAATALTGTNLKDLLGAKRQAPKKKLSYLGHKLKKASAAYLRSLFFKSTRSDEQPRRSAASGFSKAARNNSFWPSRGENRDVTGEERSASFHRRKSFSGAIDNHMQAKSSQSSSSSSSPPSSMPVLQRSASVKSDGEDSIEGAIAYCKKSLVAGRKSASDLGACTFSVASIVEMDRPSFSRG